MKIVQLLFESATHFERKHRAIDARELKLFAEIETLSADANRAQLVSALGSANLIHVYAGADFPAQLLAATESPFVSSTLPKEKRWPWSKSAVPARTLEPGGRNSVPEAVDDPYFRQRKKRSAPPYRIGVFIGSRDLRAIAEATGERLARVRDDLEWLFFDEPPTPAEFASIDVWLDPAPTENDRDGFTAEAMAAGVLPVATRTTTNRWRLDEGRAGILVPPGDPNEMAHAILGALFKPEAFATQLEQMPVAAERFRAVNRATALMRIYREVAR